MKNTKKSFSKSLACAVQGILSSLKTERNLRIHFIAAAIVILCSFIFRLTRLEWLLIIYAIGSVMTAELLNTAIEKAVNLEREEFHPVAGVAKDAAAGAVLITAIQSIVIGIIIFGPRFLDILT